MSENTHETAWVGLWGGAVTVVVVSVPVCREILKNFRSRSEV